MKTFISFFTATLFFGLFATGQKFAYVDSDYILKNIPSYEAAQAQLDQSSVAWQKEIEALYAEIDKLYKDFQAEKVLLTEEMKVKKEEEIINKEKSAKDLQKKYFGKDGELYKKRQELIKPLQDDIFNAVKELATEGNYAVVFDIAGGLTMLFTDPKYDQSDEVLKKLGYKN
ncbi:MAG: OmpH family outer membrane protein [Bacteroidota bacterium]